MRRDLLSSPTRRATALLLAASEEADQLRSHVAQLTAARDEADRAFAAEREALTQDMAGLEMRQASLPTELEDAKSRLLAASEGADQLRSHVAQLTAARDEADRAFAAEREALSQDI